MENVSGVDMIQATSAPVLSHLTLSSCHNLVVIDIRDAPVLASFTFGM